MRRHFALLIALLLLLPMAAPPGGADEERSRGPLTTRLYEIGALTHGIQDWIRPTAPSEFDGVSNEESPLFGIEAEEPFYPYGTADELIELIKQSVDPAMWEETDGADILTIGESRLVARCPRAHHDQIGVYLAKIERDALTPMSIDVRVVPAADAGLEEKGTALAAVSLSALPRQRAVAWEGFQHSYVCDYDVEVAKGASISDPIVLVSNAGLVARVQAHPAPEGGELRVNLNAVYTELAASDRVGVGEDREIEKPTYRTFRAYTDALVKPGVWKTVNTSTRVDGSKVAYEVRVTPHKVALRPTAPTHAFLDPKPFDDSGKMTSRMVDVGRLTARAGDTRGFAAWMVWPSNYTPPEPPEMREPEPLYPAEALPDTLMTIMGESGAWEQGFIEIRNGRLIMRNTPAVLDAAEGIIAKLRRASIRSVTVQAEVVETSAETARWLAEKGSFDPKDRTKAFGGSVATTRFESRILCPKDTRRHVATGTDFTYVGDYEVEIAEDSSISNPVIHYVFEGTQLDVHPRLSSTENAVLMQVSYVKTQRRQKERWTSTPHGRLDTPQMDTSVLNTSVFTSLGRTVVAGITGSGDTRHVLLLTPTLERATR
ncbi:MAG: hypothetical protein QNJ98_00025 [Planctomycetota bacterium]|nr:hypothetical protein [Planctomycetota bacterium]